MQRRWFCSQFKCQTVQIWPIDRALSGATTPDQSGLGSYGIEGVLHILQTSKTGALPSNGLMLYLGHSLGGEGVLPLSRDAVGIISGSSRQGCIYWRKINLTECKIEKVIYSKNLFNCECICRCLTSRFFFNITKQIV